MKNLILAAALSLTSVSAQAGSFEQIASQFIVYEPITVRTRTSTKDYSSGTHKLDVSRDGKKLYVFDGKSRLFKIKLNSESDKLSSINLSANQIDEDFDLVGSETSQVIDSGAERVEQRKCALRQEPDISCRQEVQPSYHSQCGLDPDISCAPTNYELVQVCDHSSYTVYGSQTVRFLPKMVQETTSLQFVDPSSKRILAEIKSVKNVNQETILSSTVCK